MRRPGRFRFMFPIIFIAAALLFSAIVMAIWNAILPNVTGVKPITYIQAIGILVLCKILFGGFHGGWRGAEAIINGIKWKPNGRI